MPDDKQLELNLHIDYDSGKWDFETSMLVDACVNSGGQGTVLDLETLDEYCAIIPYSKREVSCPYKGIAKCVDNEKQLYLYECNRKVIEK